MILELPREVWNAIAHAIRDMQSKGLTWMRGYQDLEAIWDAGHPYSKELKAACEALRKRQIEQ
jgi:hypothetical protein